jgi:hypothetical protein
MPTPKTNGGTKTDQAVKVTTTFDLERHLVTIDDHVYPTRLLTQATAKRLAAQYDGQPVPLADLQETFAGDDENGETWVVTKLKGIAKQMLGQDEQLILIRAYGPSGGGRPVGARFVSADDPEAQDQMIDALVRAQATRIRAAERHQRLVDAAKKHGIAVPE